MKRYLIFIVIAIILILVVAFAIFSNSNRPSNQSTHNQSSSNVSTSRVSTNVNEEIAENRLSHLIENSNEILQNTTSETEIATYSTTIRDKSAGRLTNISITCNTLNNTIVPNGSTFSFNETIGKPTVEKGYQEASVIINHKTEKGIGGRKLSS